MLTNMTKKLPPIHPGEMLREEFMVPFELSSNELARAIGVSFELVAEIVSEKRGIAADTALGLGCYFGNDAQSWMNLQQRYELECARRDIGSALGKIHPRVA